MRNIYQRLVSTLSPSGYSDTNNATPTTPTTPSSGRKNLSRELRVDPELQQRRQLYHCGTNFYTLDEISKWSNATHDDNSHQLLNIAPRNIRLDPVVLPRRKNKKSSSDKQNKDDEREAEEEEELQDDKKESDKVQTTTTSTKVESNIEQKQRVKLNDEKRLLINKMNNIVSVPVFTRDQEINDMVSLWRGDITQLEIDAVVNPSNEELAGTGSGTDYVIHMAAGPELAFFNSTLGGCSTGSARLSPGYRLPCKYVISTVCPTKENELALRSCYLSCLDIASMHKEIRSIAFSCIVSGEYESEIEKATDIALRTVRRWMESPFYRTKLDRIIFVVQSENAERIYRQKMPIYFPREEEQQDPMAKNHHDNNNQSLISSPANHL